MLMLIPDRCVAVQASPPASPMVPPQQTPASPQMVPRDILAQREKEVQNLTWQLQLRDSAIEKLKEALAEAKGTAQQAQALADRREEQCRVLAVKTKELLEASKAKDIEFDIQRDELQKTKALLVSMLREKQG